MAELVTQLLNGVVLGLLYAVIALGFMLILGTMEVINLSHGVLFALGGYFALALGPHVGFLGALQRERAGDDGANPLLKGIAEMRQQRRDDEQRPRDLQGECPSMRAIARRHVLRRTHGRTPLAVKRHGSPQYA